MTLIETDRAVELYRALGSAVEMSGGSAANTMCGVASFGGRAAYVGKVSDDELGQVFGHDLLAVGVAFRPGAMTEDVPTGRCIIVVTPDAQRTMNTYLGASSLMSVPDVDIATVAAGKVLYMEGYLYDRDDAKAAFRHAAQAAHRHGRLVSLTLSDSFCVDRHRDDFRRSCATRSTCCSATTTSCSRSTRPTTSTTRSPPSAATAGWRRSRVGAKGSYIITARRRAARRRPPRAAGDRHDRRRRPLRSRIPLRLHAGPRRWRSAAGSARSPPSEVISHVGPRPLVELRTLIG